MGATKYYYLLNRVAPSNEILGIFTLPLGIFTFPNQAKIHAQNMEGKILHWDDSDAPWKWACELWRIHRIPFIE